MEILARLSLQLDGTPFYLILPEELREAVEILNQCLEAVLGHGQANKLKINPDANGLWKH